MGFVFFLQLLKGPHQGVCRIAVGVLLSWSGTGIGLWCFASRCLQFWLRFFSGQWNCIFILEPFLGIFLAVFRIEAEKKRKKKKDFQVNEEKPVNRGKNSLVIKQHDFSAINQGHKRLGILFGDGDLKILCF